MRKIVLLAVALMGFTAAFAQTDVLTVAQEANDALAAKNYAKAAQLLEQVITAGAESDEDAVLEQVNSAKKNLPIATFYVGRTAAAEAQKLTDAAARDAKYAEAIATAQSKMDMYTNNEVAKLQMANDYDGIIAMAEQLDDAAMAAKITMQAYYGKKDFNKMIELAPAALETQVTDEGRSDINYLLGVAYNEKEMFEQAIAAMQNVTAGNNVANAQAVISALTQSAQ